MRDNRHADKTPVLSRARLGRHVLDGLLFISFLSISLGVLADYQEGGNSWKQGDWLINNAGTPVRRGPFGSMVLFVGDLLGASPLAVICIIQVLVLAMLFLALRALVARAGPVRVQALLLLSPAMFTVFWATDPQGAVRKELLAFAGLALVGLGALRVDRAALWLGVAVFCISTLAHEAMVLFLPMLLAILVVSGLHESAPRQAIAAGVIAICASAGAFLFALGHVQVADPGAVCAPLLDRGLDGRICDGAIKWLANDARAGAEAVADRLTASSLSGFAIAVLVALAPFACLVWIVTRRLLSLVLLILSAVPFMPLYPFTEDWGRWLSLHVFSMAVLLACAMATGRVRLRKPPSRWLVGALVALALLVSPSHMIGVAGAGARIAKDILPPPG